MRKYLLLALLFVTTAFAATIDETSSKYKPDYGSYGTVGAVVIQTSDDAYNSEPVNSAHPLPITGTTTATPVKAATATNSGVDVATTSTSVLSLNASRKKLILVNDSDTDIYVSFSGTAVANAGIRLNALGGTVSDDTYTGAVTAIHAGTGTKRLTTVEM